MRLDGCLNPLGPGNSCIDTKRPTRLRNNLFRHLALICLAQWPMCAPRNLDPALMTGLTTGSRGVALFLLYIISCMCVNSSSHLAPPRSRFLPALDRSYFLGDSLRAPPRFSRWIDAITFAPLGHTTASTPKARQLMIETSLNFFPQHTLVPLSTNHQSGVSIVQDFISDDIVAYVGP